MAHQREVRTFAFVLFKLVANLKNGLFRHTQLTHLHDTLVHQPFVLFVAALVEVTHLPVDCFGRRA